MAKKRVAKKRVAKKALPKPPPAPVVPKPLPVLRHGSFMLRAHGAQFQWAWDGKELRMTCNRKLPAAKLAMDFGPGVELLRFSKGVAHPDPDGTFCFNLNEPDMRSGWVFVPEGGSPEPLAIGVG